MSQKVIGIYKIENTRNGKVYVGQSVNIKDRWAHHRYALRNNQHDNHYLQRAWNKYGEESFQFSVIEECDSSLLNERETFWKLHYDPNTYNLGHTNSSGTMSIEARNKLREMFLGDRNPAKREDVRKKIADSRRGKARSLDCKQKISAKLTGRPSPHSEQHILALRKASPNKKRVIQLTADGEVVKVWDAVNDAARALKVSQANISDAISGKQKTCKGFIWKFAE